MAKMDDVQKIFSKPAVTTDNLGSEQNTGATAPRSIWSGHNKGGMNWAEGKPFDPNDEDQDDEDDNDEDERREDEDEDDETDNDDLEDDSDGEEDDSDLNTDNDDENQPTEEKESEGQDGESDEADSAPNETEGNMPDGPEGPGESLAEGAEAGEGLAGEAAGGGLAGGASAGEGLAGGATAAEGLGGGAAALGEAGGVLAEGGTAALELGGAAAEGTVAFFSTPPGWITAGCLLVVLLVFVFMPIFTNKGNQAFADGAPAIICVDPGHPPDGAEGEPALTLKVGTELQAALEAEGYTVIMTRTDNSDVSISARPDKCKAGNANFLYSLHADSSARAGGYPYQIYPKSSRASISSTSKDYASKIQAEVGKAVKGISGFTANGGTCEEGACTQVNNLGVFSGADKYSFPAVLTEMVQLNSNGSSILDDAGNRKKLIAGIVAGIKVAVPPRSGTVAGGGASQPPNTDKKGSGWTLKKNTDYSSYACATGSTDMGVYKHPTAGFTIRKCKTNIGVVASLISRRAVDMIAAAKKDGVTLSGSGFRSYEEQKSIYADNCSGGSCNPPTAKPGNSQHERGLATDFDNASKGGRVWNWLSKNGASYGYINLPSEYWHWSMSGN